MARVAAVSCLIIGVTGGVAAASQSALPGDPLYDVKRGIERAQVSLAQSDATEGQRLVSQATTRLDEVKDLAVTRPDDPQTTRLIQSTLAEFTDQADDGAAALITSYENDSSEESIARLRQFTDMSAQDLDQLGSLIPAPARGDLLDAARLLTDLDQEARDVVLRVQLARPAGGVGDRSGARQVDPGSGPSTAVGGPGQRPWWNQRLSSRAATTDRHVTMLRSKRSRQVFCRPYPP